MDLFAFIRHSDPTKVRIGKRELAKREVKLLKLTKGRIVPLNPPVSAASGDSGNSVDKWFDEADDAEQEHSVRRDDDVLDETVAQGCFGGSSIPSRIMEPQDDGLADSVSGLNLWTRPSSKRSTVADTPIMTIVVTITIAVDAFVVPVSKDKVRSGNVETFRDFASTGEDNVNAVSSSKLNEPMNLSYSFYAYQDLDSETLHNIYIPKWKVANDSVLDDPTSDVFGSGSENASGAYIGTKRPS
nr:hypothetical protein [Tanacetum cinerariifolium]